MKNAQHLKAYVQMHPDNKMAWYLLGKEYAKNGQQGKANYCFNQAGEVYEAFEHSKVPADMLREYEAGLLAEAGKKYHSKLRKRRYGVAAMLLLLMLLMPVAEAPGRTLESAVTETLLAEEVSGTLEELAQQTVPDNEAEMESETAPDLKFTAVAKDAAGAGQAVAGILKEGEPSATVMLGMQRAGEWLIWKERLPLAAAAANDGTGKVVYQSYDPLTCSCEVPEAEGGLKQQAAQWQKSEEQLAVLWSAMRAYKSSKGQLPQSVEQLTEPFPANVLGGTTPLMKEKFAALRQAAETLGAAAWTAEAAQTPLADDTSGGDTGSGGAGQSSPFFSEPLTIIVDKENHRLALTSGSVILRNYEVGLGGDRTPEGTFAISDKVVNPNGRDDGEFGSRGMQLSDTNYAIHGTNEEDSIGKDESLGCIRMEREDIEELFAMAPMGTKVVVTKGVLPDEPVSPEERFPSDAPKDQTNPHKVYHWLN